MSAEHHIEHHEHHEKAHDELEAARQDKLEELRQSAELAPEHAENDVEAARETIKKLDKEPEQPAEEQEAAPAPAKTPFIAVKMNYLDTVASMQTKLKPVSRSFSKFIHTPVIDKTSEAIEKTIGRPSVTLGATWTALIVGSVFYFTARHYGYMLSGSELLFSFVVGALIGIVVEGLWRLFKHKG
jgi:hypothetical protein